MECVVKPSSNISDFVSIFAKACKFKSIGVFPSSGNLDHSHYSHSQTNINGDALSFEDSSNSTGEIDCEAQKIHPQFSAEILTKPNKYSGQEILKLFDIVSAFKSAYVQLQQAHIPYDTEKIKAADELVVSRLEALHKIKRAYKEKQFKESESSSHSAMLLVEIQGQERLLLQLQSQLKAKHSKIILLQQELRNLDMESLELNEKFRQVEKANGQVLNFTSFRDTFKAVSQAVHDFAKPLISLMKASGWNLDFAANSIEDSVVYSKRSHKKYAFEAYIARRMFSGISIQQYNDEDDTMRLLDPIDALIEYPDSGFAEFCRLKYLLVVHQKMEASFFGNLDQRTFVSRGKHPRTPFYQAFVKMAKWFWILQRIAASIEPKAEIFGVRRGSEFSDAYMERVGDDKGDMFMFNKEQAKIKVEFMVMPGFRIGESVIQSRVYLSRMSSLNGIC